MRMPISLLILSGLMMLLAACDQGVDSEPQYQMSINVSIDAGEKEVSFMSPMVSAQTMAIDELWFAILHHLMYHTFSKEAYCVASIMPCTIKHRQIPLRNQFDFKGTDDFRKRV